MKMGQNSFSGWSGLNVHCTKALTILLCLVYGSLLVAESNTLDETYAGSTYPNYSSIKRGFGEFLRLNLAHGEAPQLAGCEIRRLWFCHRCCYFLVLALRRYRSVLTPASWLRRQ
ncbi:hypothetical protein ACFL2H_13080 [Planctomycetota bacterium]